MGKFGQRFAIGLSVLIVIALAAGCSSRNAGSAGTESSGGSSAGNASGGGVTLTWFMWTGSTQEADAWKELAADVTKKYPDIRIQFETASWPDYWSKLQTEVASGTTQDILSLQSLRTQGYGSAFRSLDDYIRGDSSVNIDDFDKGILSNLQYDGHQVALPYDFGPMIVFYNEDLFKKHNVPLPKIDWTWDDFMNAVKTLSDGKDYGYVNSPNIDAIVPFILSNGGKYLDDDGKYNLTDPKTIDAVQKLVDLTKNRQSPQSVATNDSNWDQEQWLAGNIGMLVQGPWEIINYKSAAKFKFGIAPIPQGPAGSLTVSAGSGFGISKTTKHPDEAYKAVTVLTSPESLTKLAQAGRAFAARDSSRPDYFNNVPDDFKPVLDYAVQHTVPYKITRTWQQANDMISKAMIPIYNGQVSVQDGLKQLQDQLNNLQ